MSKRRAALKQMLLSLALIGLGITCFVLRNRTAHWPTALALVCVGSVAVGAGAALPLIPLMVYNFGPKKPE